jgi:eukaryotic-like serine/threonine-protein kinase
MFEPMSDEAMPRRSLGRYELIQMLGQGGMGEVHLARLVGTAGFEKLCIVKTILPAMKEDPQFVDRFYHEAKVLVQLNHSNIAQVYDMGDVDDTLYMAIEYVPGVDLSRVMNRVVQAKEFLPVSVATFLGKQMCEALGYAHRKTGGDGLPLGIVHRDVSPQNVMISYEGECKVIDFGLAKSTARSKHTMPSTVMGKLGYMSPEQAMARKVDYRSDIFSAGIVVWEMFAGRPLYEQGTMGEMVARMAHPQIPSLQSIRSDISPELDLAVMKALATDPAARYLRCDDFSRALNEIAVREGHSVSSEEVGNYVREVCPQEYEKERKLQSQLSLLRSKPGNRAEPPTDTGTEGTFLRSPSQSEPKKATPMPSTGVVKRGARSLPPVVADDDDVPQIKKSKGPVIAVGVLCFVALLGIGAYFVSKATIVESDAFLSQKRTPPAVEPEKKVEVAIQTPTPVDAGTASQPEETHEMVLVPEPVYKVLKRGADYFAVMGKSQSLAVGDRLSLVGEKNAEGKRPLHATGAVIEVQGSLATLIFDEDHTAFHDDVYAAKEAIPRVLTTKTKTVKADSAKPEPVKVEPAKVDVAKVDPVKVQPVKVEPAKVEPVKVEPAKVEPVKVEPVKVEPVKVEPAKVEPVKPQVQVNQIKGTIFISLPDRNARQTVNITNSTNMSLRNCEVRLPGKRTFRLPKALPANRSTPYSSEEFKPDGRDDPNFKQSFALVTCTEGAGYFYTSFQQR